MKGDIRRKERRHSSKICGDKDVEYVISENA